MSEETPKQSEGMAPGWSKTETTITAKELLLESRVSALTDILIHIAEKNPGRIIRRLVEKIGVGMLEGWSDRVLRVAYQAATGESVKVDVKAEPEKPEEPKT